MSEWPYIIAAYSLTWTVLVAFAVYLVVRHRRAARGVGED